MKTVAVTADAAFVPQRRGKSLAERYSAILNRVMCVHFQVAIAFQLQINDRVFGEQRQHVVEKWNARADLRLAFGVQIEPDGNVGFPRFSRGAGTSRFHCFIKAKPGRENQAQLSGGSSPLLPGLSHLKHGRWRGGGRMIRHSLFQVVNLLLKIFGFGRGLLG